MTYYYNYSVKDVSEVQNTSGGFREAVPPPTISRNTATVVVLMKYCHITVNLIVVCICLILTILSIRIPHILPLMYKGKLFIVLFKNC